MKDVGGMGLIINVIPKYALKFIKWRKMTTQETDNYDLSRLLIV